MIIHDCRLSDTISSMTSPPFPSFAVARRAPRLRPTKTGLQRGAVLRTHSVESGVALRASPVAQEGRVHSDFAPRSQFCGGLWRDALRACAERKAAEEGRRAAHAPRGKRCRATRFPRGAGRPRSQRFSSAFFPTVGRSSVVVGRSRFK